MVKSNADERCRRRLDGDDPLFLPAAKMQTNPSSPLKLTCTTPKVRFFLLSNKITRLIVVAFLKSLKS